ncbi:MAG: hypothetical protein IKK87_08760 [Bacteroidaceae bacterium]|nr:hypothetical protein [Bacteroidaceae bacterium]
MKKYLYFASMFALCLTFNACCEEDDPVIDPVNSDDQVVKTFEIDEDYIPTKSDIQKTWAGKYEGNDAKQEAKTMIKRKLTLNANGTYTNIIEGILVKSNEEIYTPFEKEKGTYQYNNGVITYTVQYDSLIDYQTLHYIGYTKKHYYSADGKNSNDKANYTENAMFSVLKKGQRKWISKDTYLQQLTDEELDLYFEMDVYTEE